MNKNWVWIVLLIACLAFSFSNVLKSKRNLERVQEFLDARPLPPDVPAHLPKGEILRHVDYIGISGKTYKVPVISDGQGGEIRWMADVLWADLPIETRLNFAMGGGGHLSENDIGEIIYRYGSDECKEMLKDKE